MCIINVLGYYKSVVKNCILQFIRINKFRFDGAVIQSGVQIAKEAKLFKSNYIGHHTELNQNVILSPGAKIGNYSVISNIHIGENSFIESRVLCTGCGNGKIIIGKESYIGVFNILDWSDNITIGDYVHVAGPSTGLWTHSSTLMCLHSIPLQVHNVSHRPTAPILIENNVYIGGNCTIYPGITIGHHSVVTPNSAVTKNVPPYTMVGGVPARFIKNISFK